MNQTTFLNIPRIGWCWNGFESKGKQLQPIFAMRTNLWGVVVTF